MMHILTKDLSNRLSWYVNIISYVLVCHVWNFADAEIQKYYIIDVRIPNLRNIFWILLMQLMKH